MLNLKKTVFCFSVLAGIIHCSTSNAMTGSRQRTGEALPEKPSTPSPFLVVGSIQQNFVGKSAFSPDGKSAFISEGMRGEIAKWDLINKKLVTQYVHEGQVSSFRISRNGKFLASIDYQGSLFVFEVSTGKIIHHITDGIFDSLFIDNDSKILTLNRDSVKVWDLELDTNQAPKVLVDSSALMAFAISDNERFLITIESANLPYDLARLVLRDLAEPEAEVKTKVFTTLAVDLLTVSSDGKSIILMRGKKVFKFKLTENDTFEETAREIDFYGQTKAISNDGKSILLGGSNQEIALIDVATLKEKMRTQFKKAGYDGLTYGIMSVAFSNKDRYGLAVDGSGKIWHLDLVPEYHRGLLALCGSKKKSPVNPSILDLDSKIIDHLKQFHCSKYYAEGHSD